MKKVILLSLIIVTSCVAATELKASSFLENRKGDATKLEEERSLQQGRDGEVRDELQDDGRSEVSTLVDSNEDQDYEFEDESSLFNGERDQKISRGERLVHFETAPGDDQTKMDIDLLKNVLKNLKPNGNEEWSAQARRQREHERKAVLRGTLFLQKFYDSQQKDAQLTQLYHDAGYACYEWQRAKEANGKQQTAVHYKNAFCFYSEAIPLAERRKNELDWETLDLRIEALCELAKTYLSEAQHPEQSSNYAIAVKRYEARQFFLQVSNGLALPDDISARGHSIEPGHGESLLSFFTKQRARALTGAAANLAQGKALLEEIEYPSNF